MNILIIGAGMYVTGRGTSGFGTILPALAQFSRNSALESVTVVATQPENAVVVRKATTLINKALGTELHVAYLARQESLDDTIKGLSIDCAVVCVPDHLHFDVADTLMRRGIHCLIVKPLTPTLAQAKALVRLQEEKSLYCAVEFHKRFDEQNLFVRKVVREGRVGRPLYMTVGYSQRIAIPLETFRSWASQTNIFQYLGVHYADLIYFLTGFIPTRLLAVGTRGVLDSQGILTWDSVHTMIVWKSPSSPQEMVTQLAIGWVDPNTTTAMSDQKFLLVGSEGRLDLDQKDRGISLVTKTHGVETPNPYFSMLLDDPNGVQSFQGYGCRSVIQYLSDVRDVLAKRTSPKALEAIRPSLKESLVSTAIVEAVNRSLVQNGTWSNVDVAF